MAVDLFEETGKEQGKSGCLFFLLIQGPDPTANFHRLQKRGVGDGMDEEKKPACHSCERKIRAK